MKRTIIALFAASVLATAASAQLYVITSTLDGTGVKAEFNFTIDDAANTVTVDINNNILGDGGAKGTITEFGFNVPDSLDLSLVTFTATGTGGFDPTSWDLEIPYTLPPSYGQDLGVNGSPTPDDIAWGNTAQFVFHFNQDFVGTDAAAGWLGQDGLSVFFQEVNRVGPSDKAFGGPGGGGGGGGEGFVPEPSTYGMFAALTLLGLMVIRQMRRR